MNASYTKPFLIEKVEWKGKRNAFDGFVAKGNKTIKYKLYCLQFIINYHDSFQNLI